jgi:hypothetical protein
MESLLNLTALIPVELVLGMQFRHVVLDILHGIDLRILGIRFLLIDKLNDPISRSRSFIWIATALHALATRRTCRMGRWTKQLGELK